MVSLRLRAELGIAVGVVFSSLLASCLPAGRELELPSPDLLGGSYLLFLHVPDAAETRLVTREGLGPETTALRLGLPEGYPIEAALFSYDCPSLDALGIRLEAGGSAVGVSSPERALRAPDRLIFGLISGDGPASWNPTSFEALPQSLRADIVARLPTAPDPELPFVDVLCADHHFTDLPSVAVLADQRARFAAPLGAGSALVGLGSGELVEITEDANYRVLISEGTSDIEGAHLDASGRLWVIRIAGLERRLESIELEALRAGDVSFTLGPAPPPLVRHPNEPGCAGSRELSLTGAVGDAPFELFMMAGDGIFARFDGTTWTSTDTRAGAPLCRRKSPRVVWRAPGIAVASHDSRDALVGFERGRGFVGIRGSLPSRPTALIDVPGLGLVVGTNTFQLGVHSELAGFEALPGSEAFVSPAIDKRAETLAPARHGFYVAGDGTQLVQWARRSNALGTSEGFCVVNERRMEDGIVNLPHINFAARAGESVVLVPREFAGTSFSVSVARPGNLACTPARRL